MEAKTCKKCGRPLPENYKHKKCENCQNQTVKSLKAGCKVVLPIVTLIGGTAIYTITKGKIDLINKN